MALDLLSYLVLMCVLVLVCVLLWLLLLRRAGARIGLGTRITVWAFIVALPWLPYARIELQSLVWGRSLTPAVRAAMGQIRTMDPSRCFTLPSYMGTELRYMKVMSITPWSAVVYFVTYLPPENGAGGSSRASRSSGYSGFTLAFTRKDGTWRYSGQPGGVWTDMGNPNVGPFPPYPGYGDFPLDQESR